MKALTIRQPQLHAMHCSCDRCAPAAPPAPAEQLSLNTMGRLAFYAAGFATAIAFLVNPVGAADALRAVVMP